MKAPPTKRYAGRAPGAGVETLEQTSPKCSATAEPPEHRGERRRFLIWACMLGVVPPKRLVERIVADVEAGAAR